MAFFYNIIIHIYYFGIHVFSLFDKKAEQWIKGRKQIFHRIAATVNTNNPVAWFHCASLGEFEQGRPVMEAFRKEFPGHRILVTFFSPSGYEVRKNYEGADYIFYLPMDTSRNAKKFLELIRPDVAFFIKYEYWFNYLRYLKKMHVPVIGISSIFRPGQRFFNWYGGWQRSLLRSFDHFFVQNEPSAKLLRQAGIDQVTVSGDTRFDRVFEIAGRAKSFPVMEKFKGNGMLFIAGSTWTPDEDLIVELIHQNRENLKFIIAPHEVHKERIDALMRRLPPDSLRFSHPDDSKIKTAKVMVIDSIGILSHLYQYADVTYIGGGFGAGIHNILEAATFGKPIIFGPKYQKFQEARDLISGKGAFSVKNKNSFLEISGKLLTGTEFLKEASEICRNYVKENRGATKMIIDYMIKKLS
jgi:3-deoxy-D-manno-octulosonic-acid transferase